MSSSRPVCTLYAERRYAVFNNVPMKDIPPACGAGPGTKCKHGIHRDWEDGERERVLFPKVKDERSAEIIMSAKMSGDRVINTMEEAQAVASKQGLPLPHAICFPIPERSLIRACRLMQSMNQS